MGRLTLKVLSCFAGNPNAPPPSVFGSQFKRLTSCVGSLRHVIPPPSQVGVPWPRRLALRKRTRRSLVVVGGMVVGGSVDFCAEPSHRRLSRAPRRSPSQAESPSNSPQDTGESRPRCPYPRLWERRFSCGRPYPHEPRGSLRDGESPRTSSPNSLTASPPKQT